MSIEALQQKFNQLVQLNERNFRQLAQEVGFLKERVKQLEARTAATPVVVQQQAQQVQSVRRDAFNLSDAEKEAIFYSGDDEG